MVTTEPIVYINGEYLPQSQAMVSVLDRGFLFGDGVYEVIPVFAGKLLRLNEHLERLQRSMNRVLLKNPLAQDEWEEIFHVLLDRNPGGDRSIYLQVTRGAAPVRDLSISPDVEPTVFVMVNDIKPVDFAKLENGIDAVTVDDFRWKACDIKSVSLIANVMIRLRANELNVMDAVMVRDGLVTEGTASNIFVIHNGIISTPPKSDCLLPGITRDLVMELAQANGFKVEERDIKQDELDTADEIWLTSSTREIAPVVKLDNHVIGDGVAGEYWKKIIAIYQDYKQALRNG